MAEENPAPPALPPASLSVLALLVPFHPPLAPNILSTPLNTRHTFLPPNIDEPDTFLSSIAQPTCTLTESEQTAWAKRNPISTRLEELATSSARDDLHFGTIAYWRPDEATFLARAKILGFEDEHASEVPERAVEVEWLWEGEREMGGRGWTLHSVDLSEALKGRGEWQESRQKAWDSLAKPSSIEAERENDGEEGDAGNDFWASYSTSPQTETAIIPQDTPTGDEDNSYWAAYGSVDDGLAGTQPTTPEMRKNMSFTHLKERNWGTGGETPVSWSPQQSVSPSSAHQSAPASLDPSNSLLLSREDAQAEREITLPAATFDLTTPSTSVVLDPKHAHLVKVLSGTWDLWRSTSGGDDAASRKAFREAVDQVLNE